ncbi:MAG: RIP metalloprotease RseP [bacterium]
MLSTIIIFILILGLLVFVHELGHFIAAKKMGVRVEEFGIGFPPRLFKVKKGETIYSINLIPLGGFVKLKGEDGGEKKDEDSFSHKKIWQRILILASGVGMNFLLAVFIISIGFIIGFPQVITGNSFEKYAKIKNEGIQVMSVLEECPAHDAGILPGDIIVSMDKKGVASVDEVKNYVNEKKEEKILVDIKRDDELIEKEVYPVIMEDADPPAYVMGVGLAKVGTVKYPFYIAIFKGVETTIILTEEILKAFYQLLKNLIIVHKVTVELAGPIGIAALTGQVADLGFIYILQFIALLSINLGIINLLPFPALDGGRIFFALIEKIRGRAINENIENLIHNAGFALLMVLIIFITYRDIMNYKSAFLDFFRRIF